MTNVAGSDRLIPRAPHCDRCDGAAVVGYLELTLCGRCFFAESVQRWQPELTNTIQQVSPQIARKVLAQIVLMLEGLPADESRPS